MKKIIQFLTVLVVVLCLGGCVGQTKNHESQNRRQPAQVEAPEPVLIGAAETMILDKSESRMHNIALCVRTLNGSTLEPGETFSFNKRVGERTEKRGYRKATVLIQGEKVQDYGGGVCQVSSTIYQAVRAAGLSVTERHSHQKDVGYAQPGDDAAVDYGNMDLQFINSSEFKVKISLQILEKSVKAEVYRLF